MSPWNVLNGMGMLKVNATDMLRKSNSSCQSSSPVRARLAGTSVDSCPHCPWMMSNGSSSNGSVSQPWWLGGSVWRASKASSRNISRDCSMSSRYSSAERMTSGRFSLIPRRLTETHRCSIHMCGWCHVMMNDLKHELNVEMRAGASEIPTTHVERLRRNFSRRNLRFERESKWDHNNKILQVKRTHWPESSKSKYLFPFSSPNPLSLVWIVFQASSETDITDPRNRRMLTKFTPRFVER